MKKFLFGWIIGFFIGVYSLLALVLSNKKIRNFIKLVTTDEIAKKVEKFIYGEGLCLISPPRMNYGGPRAMSPTYYRTRSRSNRGYKSYNFPGKQGVHQFIFSTKEEAEEVLEQLQSVLDAYSAVTVGDLNDLVGFPRQHEDGKRGWASLEGAIIRQDRLGHVLILPDTEPVAS